MNPYRVLISDLPLTRESQGRHGYVFLMLSMLGDAFAANPDALTYSTSAAREVLHRLAAYDGPTVEQIKRDCFRLLNLRT